MRELGRNYGYMGINYGDMGYKFMGYVIYIIYNSMYASVRAR